MIESQLLDMVESSQVGEARRAAMLLADRCLMSEDDKGKVALIVTELATNLVKHAKDGYVLLRVIGDGEGDGVEIISVDRGPGIGNVGAALRDGYSTTGTRGHGLGSISRQAHQFDLSSIVGRGTVVLARYWREGARAQKPVLELGAVCVRLKTETVCGDLWAVHERNGRATVLVVDGLGHGRYAADAAEEAVRVFGRHAAENPADILAELHAELKKTRGAAGAVAEVIPDEHRVSFAGIGNVAGSVLTEEKRHNMVSQSGTLGAESRRVTVFDYPFPDDGLMVMATDGITTHWDLSGYPGLRNRHPGVIAAVIHRDFSRGRDDATVVVARRFVAG